MIAERDLPAGFFSGSTWKAASQKTPIRSRFRSVSQLRNATRPPDELSRGVGDSRIFRDSVTRAGRRRMAPLIAFLDRDMLLISRSYRI